jgi:hypothetical protein
MFRCDFCHAYFKTAGGVHKHQAQMEGCKKKLEEYVNSLSDDEDDDGCNDPVESSDKELSSTTLPTGEMGFGDDSDEGWGGAPMMDGMFNGPGEVAADAMESDDTAQQEPEAMVHEAHPQK